MPEIELEIKKVIESFKQMPFLFVGTGISIRYANAPSWDNLLFDVWKTINNRTDKQGFDELKQRIANDIAGIERLSDSDAKYKINPKLASVLQKEFDALYYGNDEFDKSVFTEDESRTIVENAYDPFKYYVAKLSEQIQFDTSIPEYYELESLIASQNKFAGIITTNYDILLEQLFDQFNVIIGQENLILSNSISSELYKIHGCKSCPNSIVITEEDYSRFNGKLKYLSAKLLTIFVEHPIIFLGYGLGDFNILLILEEIANCLSSDQLEKTKNNFVFIAPALDGTESIQTKEIKYGRKSIGMTEIVIKDYTSLYNQFSLIQASLPVKVIRHLQNMICSYVYSTKATNKILFGKIDDPDIDQENTAIYVGELNAISQMGFDYYTLLDICEDILYDNKPFLVNELLITKTFKNIRSTSGTSTLPIYKYIHLIGYPISSIPSQYKIIHSYDDVKPNSTDRNYLKDGKTFNTIKEIVSAYPSHQLKQMAYIISMASTITAAELQSYLQSMFSNKPILTKYVSQFKKLVALYDYKEYGSKIKKV